MANRPVWTGIQRFLARQPTSINIGTNASGPHSDEAKAIRLRCWDGALKAYATSFIFQRRARTLGIKLNVITYIGFVVPMIVGLIVLSYGYFKSLPIIISIAAVLGIAQLVVSLWSVIGGWVAGYSYASASAAGNSSLALRYEDLASNPPDDLSVLRREYEKLTIRDEDRQEQDYQQAVRESEKRMGMRAALRKYQRKCAGCGKVPTNMNATECGVCGNFRYRIS